MLGPPSRDLDRLEHLIVDLGRVATRRETHPLETDLPAAKRIREAIEVLARVRATVGSGRLSRRHLRETLAYADKLLAEQSVNATAHRRRSAEDAMAERALRELDDD